MKIRDYFISTILLIGALSVTENSFSQTSNFTGTWQLDKNRTNFGQAPEYILSRKLAVTQNNTVLSIDRTNLNATMEEKHYSEKIDLDGKSTQTLTISGNVESDSLKSGSNMPELVIGITIKSAANTSLANVVESWSLEDNGKTLVVDKQVQQADGAAYEIKGYYNKE